MHAFEIKNYNGPINTLENVQLLTNQEMQTKTKLRFHLIPERMTNIKAINNKYWQGY